MRSIWLVALVVACSADTTPHGSVVAIARDRSGVPRMIHAGDRVAAPGATPSQAARGGVERLAAMWGVAPGKLPGLDASGEVRVGGGTIVRLNQVLDGLPVWGRELRVLVGPAGELFTASGTLLASDTLREPARFVDDEARAIARAAGGKLVERALARQAWYPVGNRLIAAWIVDAYTSAIQSTQGDLTRTILAGADGRVLARGSLVADDAFSYSVFADASGEHHPFDGPISDATPHPTGVPDKSYPAYLPGPSLVTVDGLDHPSGGTPDPWLAVDATETAGNNVDAYVDLNAPSGLNNGDFRATLTGPSTFGAVYDTAQGPLASPQQQQASITSLFYAINWLHDFWYDAGFVESVSNAQQLNYGRGGREGDAILAEAQDNALGGSRNNANMATPMDGMSPRMQVYLWGGRDERTLALSPSGRTPDVNGAVFGPKDFDITGEVMVGVDGVSPNPTDGCTALPPEVSGKIVVVDRGNCTFKTKALDIQNAGGIGMIVVNNTTSSNPPTMGEDFTISTPITVGLLSVIDVEGAQLKQDVAAGTVTATMHRKLATELDGSLDATVIAHEYGHYVHHRLSWCETTMCAALSEGWADFVALMLIARAGDDLDGAFPIGVYATQGFTTDPGYYGIRRAPYSVNQGINSLSFRHMADGEPLPTNHPFLATNNNAEVHNAGEVWASALWEGYVALQNAGASFDEVRAKMARYVVAGLLLAPFDASPIETRDAILQAVLAANPADHAQLLQAFARRGFGSCAVAPPPESNNFVGIVESTVVAGNPRLAAFELDDACDQDGTIDAGETARLKVVIANQGQADLTDVTVTVTSATPGVTIASPPVTLARLGPLETRELEVEAHLDSGPIAPVAGDLTLTVESTGGCVRHFVSQLAYRFNVDDIPMSSATDTFDTTESDWLPWTAAWSHIRESALDGAWHGDDLATGSDTRLTSPLLLASTTDPLVITFQHRYSFEQDTDTAWDGGVIEYSIDDGVSWEDIATLTSPGYTGVLSNEAGNPLGDRLAFTGNNPSYPATDTVTLDVGTALAGSAFRLRFRIGTDAAVGAPGWDIDDVAFGGIVGTPFASQVGDNGVCPEPEPAPDDPIVSGGGGCCDAGMPGSSAALGFVVLGSLVRRRRSRVRSAGARSTRRA